MALGGGTFTIQNKELPGAYINFISAVTASATLSDRGITTMPLELDWGVDNEVFEVTNEDFQKHSMKIFGHAYNHEKLKGLRDLFLNATKLYAFKLTSGGVKAANDFATAKYCGIRGNDLNVVIQKNTDDNALFDVQLFLGTSKVDGQTVAAASALKANDYVNWKNSAILVITASTPLSGGTNGEVNGEAHQSYIDKIESYSFNSLGVDVTDDVTKGLYVAFVKRMRDDQGVKFQVILHQKAADFEGVINVKNKVTDAAWKESAFVYWVTGVAAGCAVNKSNQNKKYDGSFAVDTGYTQTELKKAIKAGEFMLHKVGSDIRILADINSFVSATDAKGEIFKENQTIRVIDQIANDVATLFITKYLGVVPNDKAGRISLWSDIVKIHQELNDIRAIENFTDTNITVDQGATKKSVVVADYITVINAMSQLYMTVTVA